MRSIIWMDCIEPAIVLSSLLSQSRDSLPTRTGGDDVSLRIHDPGNLRIQLKGVAIMVFTLSQGLFLLLQGGDIGDGNADSKDFSGFVLYRLIGQHQSGLGLVRGDFSHLDTWKGFAR